MDHAVASYKKTTLISLMAGVAVMSAAYLGQRFAPAPVPAPLVLVLATLGWIAGVTLLLVALGGVVVTFRHSSQIRGEHDLFITLNSARAESALLGKAAHSSAAWFRGIRRWLGAATPHVGDAVRIRSLEEISKTLDANGCLDGLPFMPEMAKFCGKTGTVYRIVDKIYDYGGRKDMRRMKDAVLIAGLRCDGGAHDGCQTRCYLLWKTAWITQADAPATVSRSMPIAFAPTVIAQGNGTAKRYVCQFTELARASSRMSPWDPRQDLRPLLAGNVTVAVTTAANAVAMMNAMASSTRLPRSTKSLKPLSMNQSLSLRCPRGGHGWGRDGPTLSQRLDRSGHGTHATAGVES